MKLVRLVVSRFLCIESADVEFGPGLNVLYGPNDLGKTSLAWALRAVLLLPHGSSQHEKFISWYAAGEPPKVQLTFSDGDNRYWRLSKTFSSGAAGRSSLEQSKDGRTFTAAVNGREVDERVRQMLGWGIPGVGGKAKTKGFPDTFLTQVLLAEQDNVRDILFGKSLSDDPDVSGRLKLTAALGALAQDPLFKSVLDEAQQQTDKAFTPGGKKKKTADSPFIALLTRIAELNREKDEIELKVRETTATEERIRELVVSRDTTVRALDQARDTQRAALARFELAQQRRCIQEELDKHLETLRSVQTLERELALAHERMRELDEDLASSEVCVRDAKAAVVEAEREFADAARDEELGHADKTVAIKQAALEEQLASATGAAVESKQNHERAKAALETAIEIAKVVAASRSQLSTRRFASATAEEAMHSALATVGKTRDALEDARERLRDATSDDQAKARELRRAELTNRILSLESQRPAIEAAARDVVDAKELSRRLTVSERHRDALVESLAASTSARSATEKKLAEHDTASARLLEVERYGRLMQVRAVVDSAMAAERDIGAARMRATELRRKAAEQRSRVQADLPDASTIGDLRKARENLRIAEARLGGGVTVVMRPRRSVDLRFSHDGISEPPTSTNSPITVSADRVVSLQVADLVDLEITAGEATARAAASTLRERWESTGAGVLRRHRAETVEELELLAGNSNRAERDAERLEADAQLAEGSAPAAIDASAEAAEVAQLELALKSVELGPLRVRFEKLGAGWQMAIKRSAEVIDRDRTKDRTTLDTNRADVTKHETQLSSARDVIEALRRELDRKLSVHAEPLAQLEQRCASQMAELDRDIAVLAKQKSSLAEGASDAEATAQARIKELEVQLASETEAHKRAEDTAAKSRDLYVQETTRLEASEGRARAHDKDGAWREALARGDELVADAWDAGLVQAQRDNQTKQNAAADLKEAIVALQREQTETVERARERRRVTESAAVLARRTFETMNEAAKELTESRATTLVGAANLQAKRAIARPESASAEIEQLQVKLAALATNDAPVDQLEIDRLQANVGLLQQQVAEMDDDLLRLQIELQHAGGAVVRERRDELTKSIELASQQQQELTIEYDAWQLLLETLRASESTQGAHLGSQLAGPVSRRFRDLTGGRYGAIEMGADLEAEGLQVAGQIHEFGALSAGTQDQLATLLRLCIAEQIKSSIVLDDHLSQSDPVKISWFNTALRAASSQIQVVLITCRPGEHLTQSEQPSEGEASRSGAAGLLRAVDMSHVIRRFASST